MATAMEAVYGQQAEEKHIYTDIAISCTSKIWIMKILCPNIKIIKRVLCKLYAQAS